MCGTNVPNLGQKLFNFETNVPSLRGKSLTLGLKYHPVQGAKYSVFGQNYSILDKYSQPFLYCTKRKSKTAPRVCKKKSTVQPAHFTALHRPQEERNLLQFRTESEKYGNCCNPSKYRTSKIRLTSTLPMVSLSWHMIWKDRCFQNDSKQFLSLSSNTGIHTPRKIMQSGFTSILSHIPTCFFSKIQIPVLFSTTILKVISIPTSMDRSLLKQKSLSFSRLATTVSISVS